MTADDIEGKERHSRSHGRALPAIMSEIELHARSSAMAVCAAEQQTVSQKERRVIEGDLSLLKSISRRGQEAGPWLRFRMGTRSKITS